MEMDERAQMVSEYRNLITKYGGGHALLDEIDRLDEVIEDRNERIAELLDERSQLKSEILLLKIKLNG